jgi:hypothetical protein
MFFHFNQNNSGGNFVFDEQRGIGHHVIVEADNYKQANRIAEDIGLYFDGCADDIDCPCCGDRWYEQYKENGDEVPSIYGTPVHEADQWIDWNPGKPTAFVHYSNGLIESVVLPKKEDTNG